MNLVPPRFRRFVRAHGRTLLMLGFLIFFTVAALHSFAQTVDPTGPAVMENGAAPGAGPAAKDAFQYFGFLWNPNFSNGERIALFGSAFVAILALAYALMLVKQVVKAD